MHSEKENLGDPRHDRDSQKGILAGKKILITGGASGLGRTLVEMCVAEGAEVAFTYRKSADGARKLLERYTGKVQAYSADASDYAATENVVKDAIKAFGQIDVLVNNAASSRHAQFLKLSADDLRYSLENTLISMFNYTRAVAPHMVERRSGTILSIGSINGERGREGSAPYCAAKAAVEGLSKTIAKELGEYGISCNVISPGFIATEGQESTSPLIKKLVLDECAIRHLVKPEEIGNLLIFLASDRAKSITGQVYRIDCGQYI